MLSPAALVAWMQALPPEAIEAAMVLASFVAPLLWLRLLGATGLTIHVVLGVLVANLQVLKTTQFAFLPEPVALGTATFASTYLASDMLTEHYGAAAARRAVLAGFLGYAIWTGLMLLTLGYRVPPGDTAQGPLEALMLPAPALFAAGMISYLVSQAADIAIFQRVRRRTGAGRLWLRTNASTLASALLDSIVFSTLAWVVFAAEPIGWRTLALTYILGTYVLRVGYSLLETPFMYASRWAARQGPA